MDDEAFRELEKACNRFEMLLDAMRPYLADIVNASDNYEMVFVEPTLSREPYSSYYTYTVKFQVKNL